VVLATFCGQEYLPDFVPAMKRAAAIVTDEGGPCHAAIVSRAWRPASLARNGQRRRSLRVAATVDGSRGLVYEGKLNRLAWAQE
jgi:phosphoenolpyruvate synthase/pyruvate phosphate dikinase